jgi:type VI secretion system secreted protein Hcp
MARDIFLKLDGIKGESKDAKHKDEIDIQSWTWGASQQGNMATGGGGGAGKVQFREIIVTKSTDKASTPIFQYLCNLKHIPTGLLTVRKAGEKPLEFLKIKLHDIIITSLQFGGSHGDDNPTESVTLSCAKFYIEYYEQKADGSGQPGSQMGWDIKANEKL